jgi:hypothetical protein
MSTAVIGFLGVIAGAIVTGGIQLVVAWLDRRRASRTAARLLYMQLWWAHNAIDGLLTDNAWNPHIDWHRFTSAWAEHRADLARMLKTKNFMIASAAFTALEQLSLCREEDMARPEAPSLSPTALDLTRIYDSHVQGAKVVLNRASFGWWEWRIRRNLAHKSQSEAEGRPPHSQNSRIGGVSTVDTSSTPDIPTN